MWDTLINFWNMGIQSFLKFGDNCQIFLKDMGYFLKKLMGYGILEPPLAGPHYFIRTIRLPASAFTDHYLNIVLPATKFGATNP